MKPLDLLRHVCETSWSPHTSSEESLAALAQVEALVQAARHVVYPFDFSPEQPLDEWLGSELLRALSPFHDTETKA